MTVTISHTWLHKHMSISTLFLLSILWRVTYAAQGCKPSKVGTEGFDMKLYHYDYYNTSLPAGWCFSSEYQKYEYQHGGYVTFAGGLFASTTGVTDVSLNIYPPELCTPYVGTLPSNFNYNEEFTISNFTMLLTGYFKPSMTGHYMFNLEADDLAYLSFGDGNAFDCCGQEASVTDPDAFDLIVIWQSPTDLSGNVTYYLEEDIYYPIRLLYANRDFYGVLHLTYTDPNGVEHDDFTEHIYQADDQVGGCANEVVYTTTGWTGTYTTTYSTTVYTSFGTDGFGTIETTYYIETPEPHTTSTTYTPGPVTDTTTVSTYTSMTVGTDSITTTETVYVVETPTSSSELSTSSSTPSSSVMSTSQVQSSSSSTPKSEGSSSAESSIGWSTVSVPSNIPSTKKEVTSPSSLNEYTETSASSGSQLSVSSSSEPSSVSNIVSDPISSMRSSSSDSAFIEYSTSEVIVSSVSSATSVISDPVSVSATSSLPESVSSSDKSSSTDIPSSNSMVSQHSVSSTIQVPNYNQSSSTIETESSVLSSINSNSRTTGSTESHNSVIWTSNSITGVTTTATDVKTPTTDITFSGSSVLHSTTLPSVVTDKTNIATTSDAPIKTTTPTGEDNITVKSTSTYTKQSNSESASVISDPTGGSTILIEVGSTSSVPVPNHETTSAPHIVDSNEALITRQSHLELFIIALLAMWV